MNPMKIACLGPEFTFSEEALSLYLPNATRVPIANIAPEKLPRIFAERTDVEAVLVPVFNNNKNNAGRGGSPFAEIYADIISLNLYVTGAYRHSVRWCAASHSQLNEADVLCTMHQGPKQCGTWIRNNLRGLPVQALQSTSEAMLLASKARNAVALGSERAANNYGVPVRALGIEDNSDNATWFFLLQKEFVVPQDGSHTLIVASLAGQALADLPTTVNLRARWESGIWEFIEVRGPSSSEETKGAVAVLAKYRGMARIIGCYKDEPEEWK